MLCRQGCRGHGGEGYCDSKREARRPEANSVGAAKLPDQKAILQNQQRREQELSRWVAESARRRPSRGKRLLPAAAEGQVSWAFSGTQED